MGSIRKTVKFYAHICKELLLSGLGKLWMQVDIDDISHLSHVAGISVEDVKDILQFSDLTGPTGVRIKW